MRRQLDAAGIALAAFFFALTALYVPFLLDPAVMPRWALLSVGVPVFWAAVAGTPRFTFSHAAGLAFLALAVLSLSWTPGPLREGLDAIWQLLLLAGLFSVGAHLTDLRPVWLGAGLGMTLNSTVAFWQWLGWHGWVERLGHPNTAIDGLFFNSTWSSEAAALVLIGCVTVRLWPLALLIAPTILLSGARAAMLAVAGATAAWLWSRSRIAVLGLALAAVVSIYNIPHLGGGNQERSDLWRDIAEDLTWRGHGVGSFYLTHPEHAPREDTTRVRAEHAHNDFLEVTYELGPVGLLAFFALLAYAFAGTTPTRFVVAGFAVIACFSFPLHEPVTASLAALCCGHLCRDRPSLRYLLARGRMALQRARAGHVARGVAVSCETGGAMVSARGSLSSDAGVLL